MRPPDHEVRQAIEAALDVGRYDIAQQIAQNMSYDGCVLCGRALATSTAQRRSPFGPVNVQACAGCLGDEGNEW